MNNVNLENISDLQKTLLTQIAYLNINDEGRRKIEEEGLVVFELYSYLENPDNMFVIDDSVSQDVTELISDNVLGDNGYITHKQLLDSIVNNGLGNLLITDVSERKNGVLSSGFQALTFVDSYGNHGISYRGSDFNFSAGAVRDWLEADVLEYFTGSSAQIREACDYFEENKNSNGNNFIYGHSLGGNLTSHVYLNNYEEIREAFTINGNPINQILLDTPEKVATFNDPEKFHCNIVGGDIVGHFKSTKVYGNNVKYIQNNSMFVNSPIGAHLVQSASFDENGNFIYIDEEEMKKEMGVGYRALMNFSKMIRELLNIMEKSITKQDYKILFEVYKKQLLTYFEQLKEHFKDCEYLLDSNVMIDNLIESNQLFDDDLQEFVSMFERYLENNKINIEDVESKVLI